MRRAFAHRDQGDASGGEQIEIVHRGDDFAAGEEFLEGIAVLKSAVVEDALPESDAAVRVGHVRELSGVDHESLFSSSCATGVS